MVYKANSKVRFECGPVFDDFESSTARSHDSSKFDGCKEMSLLDSFKTTTHLGKEGAMVTFVPSIEASYSGSHYKDAAPPRKPSRSMSHNESSSRTMNRDPSLLRRVASHNSNTRKDTLRRSNLQKHLEMPRVPVRSNSNEGLSRSRCKSKATSVTTRRAAMSLNSPPAGVQQNPTGSIKTQSVRSCDLFSCRIDSAKSNTNALQDSGHDEEDKNKQSRSQTCLHPSRRPRRSRRAHATESKRRSNSTGALRMLKANEQNMENQLMSLSSSNISTSSFLLKEGGDDSTTEALDVLDVDSSPPFFLQFAPNNDDRASSTVQQEITRPPKGTKAISSLFFLCNESRDPSGKNAATISISAHPCRGKATHIPRDPDGILLCSGSPTKCKNRKSDSCCCPLGDWSSVSSVVVIPQEEEVDVKQPSWYQKMKNLAAIPQQV